MNNVTLIFDGGNGGHKVMKGYGSLIYTGLIELTEPVRLEFTHSPMTSNQAEYSTLLMGLRAINQQLLIIGFDPGAVDLLVLSDSELVVRQMSGIYACRNIGLLPLYREAENYGKNFRSVEYRWHSRVESVKYFGH